jgi:hypothetical protein
MKIQTALTLSMLSAVSLLTACASGSNSGSHGTALGTDAAVQRLVSEDDHVRIEELRVRGQTQRLSVQNKDSALPGYDILPPTGGHDPSKGRDAAGQRVWPVLAF